MNNFVFSQDPLLYQGTYPRSINFDTDMKQNIDDAYLKYRKMQEQYRALENTEIKPNDAVKELNDIITSLTPLMSEKLLKNEEYGVLNERLQGLVQRELIESIKWKINTNPKAINNIERQIEIINSVKKEAEEEERQNMNEINEYVKNYSNMTFDEYRKIKAGINNNENNKRTKK